MLWEHHPLSAMCGGLSEQANVQALRLRLTKRLQQDGEAVGSETRQLPPAGVAGRGFDGGIPPVRLLPRLDALEGLHALAGPAAPEGEVEAPAACVVAEAPHRLGGRLPSSGRAGAQAARALLDTGRRLSRVFLAWLGLGRFRLALSW
jgi:hypothetical protein